jgi:fructoselysine-6-P-deglycase FrlB-like protein
MKHESYKEISKQHIELRKTFQAVTEQADALAAFLNRPGDVVFVASGSSFWLSMAAARSFALHGCRRAFAVKAGDVVLNPMEYRDTYDSPLLICPSRSGMTTEQLIAIRILKDIYGDIPVLAIVEYESTELEKMAAMTLRLPWANEVSVCQTRSFSCLYLALVLIIAAAAGKPELTAGMEKCLTVLEQRHEEWNRAVAGIVDEFTEFGYLVTLGSGRQYGVAIEGAYIGIEMAHIRANYYSVLELRHGPIVTVGHDTLVAMLSNGSADSLEEDMAADAKRRGAKLLAVVGKGGFSGADWVFELGGDPPAEAVALLFIFVMQSFAYFQALRLGVDPDSFGDLVPYIRLP